MTGDDEGARPKPDPSPDGAEAGEPVPAAAEALPDPVAPSPVDPTPVEAAVLTPNADRPATEPSIAAHEAEPVSLRPVWIALIAGFVILAGAVLYLFSLAPDPARPAAVDKAIADLRTQVATLQAKPAAPDIAPLTQRLDAADKAIAGIRSEVDALKSQPAAPAPTPAPAPAVASVDLAPLTAKVNDLEQGLGALRSGLPDTLKQATAGLDDRLTALSAKVDGLPKVDLGPLTAKVDSLDQRLQPIEAEFKAAKSAERVTQVRQNGSAADTRAAPLAVTAEAVRRAIDAGRPFGDDVKVLARLGADANALAPLRAVADTGAPTLTDLRTDLAELRGKITAQAQPAATGSYLDRLMAGAATMVQVRPLGSVVGDTPPAILARIDDDIARDDLAAATAEWQKLPAEARTLGKSFAERLRLRLAAEEAARGIGVQAIQAMAADQP